MNKLREYEELPHYKTMRSKIESKQLKRVLIAYSVYVLFIGVVLYNLIVA